MHLDTVFTFIDRNTCLAHLPVIEPGGREAAHVYYVDLYAITPPGRPGDAAGLKELAFNDLYLADGQKLGTVQSFGVLPPPPIIVAGMEQDLRDGPRPWMASLFRVVRPAMSRVIRRIAPRGEFGEKAQLVGAAFCRQLLFGERDRTFRESRAIGRQHRAIVA